MIFRGIREFSKFFMLKRFWSILALKKCWANWPNAVGKRVNDERQKNSCSGWAEIFSIASCFIYKYHVFCFSFFLSRTIKKLLAILYLYFIFEKL
jgi:hypothetical protein